MYAAVFNFYVQKKTQVHIKTEHNYKYNGMMILKFTFAGLVSFPTPTPFH